MVNQYNPDYTVAEFNKWLDKLPSFLWYRCRLEFDIVEYRMRTYRIKKRYQRNKPP